MIIGGLLVLPLSADADVEPRAFQISLYSGVLQTRDLLTVTDKSRFSGSLELKMGVVRHLGYFVEVTVGPGETRRPRPGSFAATEGTLLGFMAAGAYAEGSLGPCIFGYAFGYGATGDGRHAKELFLHKITVRRPIRGRLFGLLGGRWFRRGGARALGLSAGVGWRL